MSINYTFNLYRIYFPSLNSTNQQRQIIRSGPQKSRDSLMPPPFSPDFVGGKNPEVTSRSAEVEIGRR